MNIVALNSYCLCSIIHFSHPYNRQKNDTNVILQLESHIISVHTAGTNNFYKSNHDDIWKTKPLRFRLSQQLCHVLIDFRLRTPGAFAALACGSSSKISWAPLCKPDIMEVELLRRPEWTATRGSGSYNLWDRDHWRARNKLTQQHVVPAYYAFTLSRKFRIQLVIFGETSECIGTSIL